MPATATGSPLGPFGDAVLDAVAADDAIVAFVGDRVRASVKDQAKSALPFIVGARRDLLPGAVAMQREGGRAAIWVDVWSDKNGPNEVQQILSRIRAVLQRRALTVSGYTVLGGSLVCDEEHVFPDFDPDMPQRTLYHGVQKWSADLEESL